MSNTVLNSTGAINWSDAKTHFSFVVTHNFTTNPCLSANTISYLLPADIIVTGGACKNHEVGTTANLLVGVTGNTNYIVAAKAMQIVADWVVALDVATEQVLPAATNYLVLDPDADMIAGRITIVLTGVKLPDIN